jgi:hypothetical protein
MPSVGEMIGSTVAGNLTQQSRVGYWQRRLIRWEVPHKLQFIEMYINPQNIRIASQKQIQEIRTKGGFMVQYWGEMFDKATITGHTGSGGIEGINVLREVYRTEFQKFEGLLGLLVDLMTGTTHGIPNASEMVHVLRTLSKYGEEKAEEFDPAKPNPSMFSTTFLKNLGNSLFNPTAMLGGRQRGTLAELATSVTMHYQGISYRGFFTAMNVTEDGTTPGIFQYDMEFTIIETYGERKNFMPWHRKATAGKEQESSYQRMANQTMEERWNEISRTGIAGNTKERTAFANTAGTLSYKEVSDQPGTQGEILS